MRVYVQDIFASDDLDHLVMVPFLHEELSGLILGKGAGQSGNLLLIEDSFTFELIYSTF